MDLDTGRMLHERMAATHFTTIAPVAAAIGGLLTTIRRSFRQEGSIPESWIAVLGRVLWVWLLSRCSTKPLHIVNLHSVGSTVADLKRLWDAIEAVSAQGEIVLMAGDYNFGTGDVGTLTIGTTSASGHDRERRGWERHLLGLCALAHDKPTRAALEHTTFAH